MLVAARRAPKSQNQSAISTSAEPDCCNNRRRFFIYPVMKKIVLLTARPAHSEETRNVRRTMDIHSLLRKQLGLIAATPVVLLTVYAVGYMFTKQLLVSV
jgi:hypothetical protein